MQISTSNSELIHKVYGVLLKTITLDESKKFISKEFYFLKTAQNHHKLNQISGL